MSQTTDTIAAIATAPGQAGVGIVRVSGPEAAAIAQAMLGYEPKPRYAHYGPFLDRDGGLIDEGIGLFFPNPHSFTGEDVIESMPLTFRDVGEPGYLAMDSTTAENLGAAAPMTPQPERAPESVCTTIDLPKTGRWA